MKSEEQKIQRWDLFIKACRDVKVSTTNLTEDSLLWYIWKAGRCSSETSLKKLRKRLEKIPYVWRQKTSIR